MTSLISRFFELVSWSSSSAEPASATGSTVNEMAHQQAMDEPASAVSRFDLLNENYEAQNQCPLFSVLSAEIRDRIFAFALADFQDDAQSYGSDTCYRRPGQEAPRRTDTRLLQTCKRVYHEAYFRPAVSAEHHLWLTHDERRPEGSMTIEKLQTLVTGMQKSLGYSVLEHVRICAQLWCLEPGGSLQTLLDIECFHPKKITITVRHTDFWWWENDKALAIKGQWVNTCVFPDSLRILNIEIESLERKKNQIDDLAAQIVKRWCFKRRSSSHMVPGEKPIEIYRWSGKPNSILCTISAPTRSLHASSNARLRDINLEQTALGARRNECRDARLLRRPDNVRAILV